MISYTSDKGTAQAPQSLHDMSASAELPHTAAPNWEVPARGEFAAGVQTANGSSPDAGKAVNGASGSAAETVDPLKSALIYLAAVLFCALFGAVYELFSHEVYSYYMIYAFAIPLALGVLPNLVIALKGWRAPGRLTANVWNSGVAALTVGCIFQGALEIYGTTNRLAVVYPVVAVALLVAGAVLHARGASAKRVRDEKVDSSPARVALFRMRSVSLGKMKEPKAKQAETPQATGRIGAPIACVASSPAECWSQPGGAR